MFKKHFALNWYQWLCVFFLACLLALPRNAAAIDLNQASSVQLQSLPGIGPKTAELIVEERTRAGAFSSLDDLSARVRGIGPKKRQALQEAGLKVQKQSTKPKPATSK